MPHLDSSFLEQGSLLLVFAALLVAGIGVPLPEDVTLLIAGALVHRGMFGAPTAVAVCLAGVVASDVVLFQITRRLGNAALRIERIERMKGSRWRRIEQLFQRYGGRLVFAARFVAGLRATTFAVAGVHGMPLRRFVGIDAAAAALSVPLMLGLGYFFADRLDAINASVSHVRELMLLLLIAAALAYFAHAALQRRRTRRAI